MMIPASTTAFTSVPASRSFGNRGGSASMKSNSIADAVGRPTTTAADNRRKVDWPQPVREYVQRAFMPEHNVPGIERVQMEEKLKQTITKANESNQLMTIDWDKLPLPQELIQMERTGSGTESRELVGKQWPKLTLHHQQRPQSSATSATSATSANGLDRSGVAKNVASPMKRKSSELHQSTEREGRSSMASWPMAVEQKAYEDSKARALAPDFETRLSVRSDKSGESKGSNSSSKFYDNGANHSKRQRRANEAGTGYTTLSQRNQHRNGSGREDVVMHDEPEGPVVGRSTALEKKYFRLTAPPNPDTVRPLPVLRQALDLLKKKWRAENNYAYICDQFKSLRQDLTVQHVKNDFSVHVYETHARIALEKGDLGEYNQCQTQLRVLYAQNLGGRPMEFKAYRILYLIHTGNRTAMNDLLAELSPAEKREMAVKHALDVRSSLALGNYHRFFRLYLDTPHMGAYLMDMFVQRERVAAIANICRAYKSDVNLRFVTEELGFESDHESLEFLTAQQAQHFLEARDNTYRFLTSKAVTFFEAAKSNAFRRVDIKGQI